jgi:bifunctional DNA-binding transcriptional regulator/antitoxin component of YhaV-PrlF toxin-antitoxin module
MGYKTEIQLIRRARSEQWYANFPAAVAQAIELEQGEVVEWLIDNHQNIVLQRSDDAAASLKKTQIQEVSLILKRLEII